MLNNLHVIHLVTVRIPHPPSWTCKKGGMRNALAALDGVVDNVEVVRWSEVMLMTHGLVEG